ncbi:MAG: metallophosphoesterase [Planctomycetota bacterium]|nr:metallophosphoesterase [Planctomycetota bacterium]
MKRILVLSDLHFGLPARRTPGTSMLRPLWQDVDHLLINGDTAELHTPSMAATAARELELLLSTCEQDGVGLSCTAGNHDPFLSPMHSCALADGRVLVVHGHRIHRTQPRPLVPGQVLEHGDTGSLDGRHRMDTAALEDGLARSRRYTPPEEELQAPQTFLESIPWVIRKPLIVPKILRYWKKFPGHADTYASHVLPGARVVLVGHSHRQGIWRFPDRLVINTGSWTWPGRPWGILVEGTMVRVHEILVKGEHLRLSDSPRLEYDVAQA